MVIQLNSAMAIANINHQRGTKDLTIASEVEKILSWAEIHVPALSFIHMSYKELFMVLQRDRVMWRSRVSFLPKAVLAFYLNEDFVTSLKLQYIRRRSPFIVCM